MSGRFGSETGVWMEKTRSRSVTAFGQEGTVERIGFYAKCAQSPKCGHYLFFAGSCVDSLSTTLAQGRVFKIGSHQVKRLFATLIVCMALSSCGGSGDGSSDNGVVTPPPPSSSELVWDEGNWDDKEWT